MHARPEMSCHHLTTLPLCLIWESGNLGVWEDNGGKGSGRVHSAVINSRSITASEQSCLFLAPESYTKICRGPGACFEEFQVSRPGNIGVSMGISMGILWTTLLMYCVSEFGSAVDIWFHG